MSFPILLFAAGLGTRMGDMVADKPKPLIKVGGKTLIDHALDFTEIVPIRQRVVNLHYKADMIRDHLAGTDILFSDETDQLLETGGGLQNALSLLGKSPVATMNTDAVWHGPNPLETITKAWRNEMDALLLTVPRAQVSGHLGKGDFFYNEKGQLYRGPGDIYTGVQIIRTEALADITDTVFSMNIVWDQIAARGGLYGVHYDGQWCDVGQPSSIPLAEAMLHV